MQSAKDEIDTDRVGERESRYSESGHCAWSDGTQQEQASVLFRECCCRKVGIRRDKHRSRAE